MTENDDTLNLQSRPKCWGHGQKAMDPKLRVIRVRDGSLLDKDSMALLAEFADANDMQVWIETVQSGRPGAIVVEDGMVPV